MKIAISSYLYDWIFIICIQIEKNEHYKVKFSCISVRRIVRVWYQEIKKKVGPKTRSTSEVMERLNANT